MLAVIVAVAAASIVLIAALAAADAAHAQLLSDTTGLINRLEIPTGAQTYEVTVTSSFDVVDYSFDVSNVTLTLQTGSVLSENLAEIVVPRGLLSGEIKVLIDGARNDADVRMTDAVALLVLEFEGGGSGNNDTAGSDPDTGRTIEITGTETMAVSSYTFGYDPDTVRDVVPGDDTAAGSGNDNGGGCLVATAAFGSEMSAQVQHLREIRDAKVASTESGRAFLSAFNSVYYVFSPYAADVVRENSMLQDATRAYMSPLLASLAFMENAREGSETDVLGYGLLVIALNLGIYAAPPVALAAAAAVTALDARSKMRLKTT